jgi:hypothetical protein
MLAWIRSRDPASAEERSPASLRSAISSPSSVAEFQCGERSWSRISGGASAAPRRNEEDPS